MGRILIFALSSFMVSAVCRPQAAISAQASIDLAKLGYPEPPCDYMFQDKDAYAKRHIEFLDSERLLVSFPLRSQRCNKQNPYLTQPQRFRTLVLATSGNPLKSFDWSSGENVQAGPDGRILVSTGRDVQILDSNFVSIQNISWVREDDPVWKLTHQWMGRVVVSPAGHGFLIHDGYPPYRVAYFAGNPAQETVTADSCPGLVAVTNGGFGCGQTPSDQGGSGLLTLHVDGREWRVHDTLLRGAIGFALPTPEIILMVTNDFQLYQFIGATGKEKLADLHWLAPGWNSGFRFDVVSAAAPRVLFFSHGARFPISNSNGFGRYLRVAVFDVNSRRIIFRRQYAIGSDVAISADGHLLAVREKDHVLLIALP